MGLWEGDAAQAHFADVPEVALSGPPTCPYHPTFLSRSAPADVLAVMEVAEQSVLFFVGPVHHLEFTKGDNVDAEQEIHFAISIVAPTPPAHHTVAPGEHRPSVAQPQVHARWGLVDPLPV